MERPSTLFKCLHISLRLIDPESWLNLKVDKLQVAYDLVPRCHILHNLFQQFIHLYRKLEKRRGDVLKWGDEVEYIIVKFDRENKKAQLALKVVDNFLKLFNFEVQLPHMPRRQSIH